MQHLNVPYNFELCLRNKQTAKCVGIQTSTQRLRADYPPAYIEIREQLKPEQLEKPSYTLRLRILSRDDKQEAFLVQGSKIHLINAATEEYVTCSSVGDIKFDKKSGISEEVNKHLYKASTWTVQFLRNQTKVIQTEKEVVTIYDQIVLKSVHSTYLTLKPGSFQLWASQELDPSRSVWSFIKANVPYFPEWVFKRNAFNKFSQPSRQETESMREKKLLKSFPPEVQEILLVEDILDIMMGFDGVYIKKHKTLHQFVIEPHLEQPSCNVANKQLAEKILNLPLMYYKVENYINVYSIQEGIMCQALCGGLRIMVKEYKTMVCQFDQEARNGLTLQKLWFLMQPSIKIMESFSKLVTQAQKFRGGQLITVLSKFLNENTDEQIIQVYNFLFSHIVKVYITILSKWLYEGIIEDKFNEFMIKTEEKSQNKEWSYWEEKFMIREDMVPSIFAKEANQILVIGKYLNILKACKKMGENPYKKDIETNLQRYISLQNFSEPILKAHEWTNSQMLELVFNDCKLQDVLKSVKGYFFLEFGDLFVHFMDAAEEDLLTPKKKTSEGQKTKVVSEEKMQSLFELLIRTSSANNDPFKDEVTCKIEGSSLFDQIHRIKTLEPQKLNFDFLQKPFLKKDSKYMDFITIEYKTQFPLSLIFNKKSMSKYQVLFRFLFWAKFVERQLNSVWLALLSTKEVQLPYFTPAHLLCQRMISFIKNFVYYLCYEVIEENWLVFLVNLRRAKTFEEIIDCHGGFLNNCLKETLLANGKLLAIITAEVGKACENFVVMKTFINNLMQKFHFEPVPSNPKTGSIIAQRKTYIEEMKDKIEKSLEEEDFQNIIEGYGGGFDDAMRKLLREVYQMIGKQESHLVNLVNRLDEERFYNKRLFGGNFNGEK